MVRRMIPFAISASLLLPVGARAQAPLTPAQREQQAVDEYRRTGVAPPIAQGDVLRLPYNHGQTTLTCAVLKTCTVKLRGDEDILFAKAADPERWQVYETI